MIAISPEPILICIQRLYRNSRPALHVNVGALGLYIRRSNRNEEGVITDVDQEYWLHDVLDLHFEARA